MKQGALSFVKGPIVVNHLSVETVFLLLLHWIPFLREQQAMVADLLQGHRTDLALDSRILYPHTAHSFHMQRVLRLKAANDHARLEFDLVPNKHPDVSCNPAVHLQ
jgi:hypothetical protein